MVATFSQITSEVSLTPNQFHIVILTQLEEGSEGFSFSVNGVSSPVTTSSFSRVNFAVFEGPLFIGGHPDISTIQVRVI